MDLTEGGMEGGLGGGTGGLDEKGEDMREGGAEVMMEEGVVDLEGEEGEGCVRRFSEEEGGEGGREEGGEGSERNTG